MLGTAEARARNGAAGAVEEDARLTALFLWTIQGTASNGQTTGGEEADETAFRGTGEFDDADADEGGEEGEDDEGEDFPSSTRPPPNDLRLVPLPPSDRTSSSSSPSSPASIAKEIFSAMCEAAAMNPAAGEELGEEGDDDDDGGEWFYDEKEVAEGLAAAAAGGAPPPLSSAGAERLARYDALLQMPRAEDLDELLDDEGEGDVESGGGEDFDEDDEEEEEGRDDDDDDDGRFDDPEPEEAAAAATDDEDMK